MKRLKERWFEDLKLGDKVRIIEKDGNDADYPFAFIIDMSKHVREVFTLWGGNI